MSKTEILRSVKIENESILKSEYEKGKGIILITAHLGNWEMLAARLAAGNYPLTVIGRDQEDKYLNELLISTREKLGIVNISKKPGVYKPIISALRNGEVIGLLADQNGGRSGIFVKFFDTPASTFKGPAYFTLRSGSSAIPIFCFRISFNSHIIEILPPIEISKDKGKKDFIFEFTQRYTSIIEQEIRKNPEQWLWLHDRWKTKLINSL